MVVKQISIQDLKANLSAVVAEAEAGATIVVTRHNAPVARLSPARAEFVHHGRNAGPARLRRAVRRNTKGRFLDVLLEDRGGR